MNNFRLLKKCRLLKKKKNSESYVETFVTKLFLVLKHGRFTFGFTKTPIHKQDLRLSDWN